MFIALVYFIFSSTISILVSVASSLIITSVLRYMIGYNEEVHKNKILKEQLEKSALIVLKQQEKVKEIGDEIDLMQKKILLSKQQLESTFDAISDSICVIDKDFTILRVNKSFSELVKSPIRELLGRKCYHVFLHNKVHCNNCPSRISLETGEVTTRSLITKTEKDITYYYEISAFPVKNDKGEILSIIETIRDITEQRRMNEQLIRSEKLASIGIMTAGIAHEMNNPLSGISGNAANMLNMPEKYGLKEKGILRIKSMLEAAERATIIMKNLLDLSHRHERQFIFADVKNIIKSTIEKIHLPNYSSIPKELIADLNLSPVYCDPMKIEQVMLNLLTNAYYSVVEKSEKYKLNPETFTKEYYGKIYIKVQKELDKIVISVEDNGSGIPEKNLKFIFDPFFTTRPPGQGTGLGLSISHKIITEHNGKIWAENLEDGAVFKIELPTDKKIKEMV